MFYLEGLITELALEDQTNYRFEWTFPLNVPPALYKDGIWTSVFKGDMNCNELFKAERDAHDTLHPHGPPKRSQGRKQRSAGTTPSKSRLQAATEALPQLPVLHL